jgi:putative transposase
MLISGHAPHRFLIHHHDSIYSDGGRSNRRGHGSEGSQDTAAVPQANAFCERVIGTFRRECLDWMIPLTSVTSARILWEWVAHYNRGRPHASLGPGIPDGTDIMPVLSGHRIRQGHRVVAAPILAGLHHEYRLERRAA